MGILAAPIPDEANAQSWDMTKQRELDHTEGSSITIRRQHGSADCQARDAVASTQATRHDHDQSASIANTVEPCFEDFEESNEQSISSWFDDTPEGRERLLQSKEELKLQSLPETITSLFPRYWFGLCSRERVENGSYFIKLKDLLDAIKTCASKLDTSARATSALQDITRVLLGTLASMDSRSHGSDEHREVIQLASELESDFVNGLEAGLMGRTVYFGGFVYPLVRWLLLNAGTSFLQSRESRTYELHPEFFESTLYRNELLGEMSIQSHKQRETLESYIREHINR